MAGRSVAPTDKISDVDAIRAAVIMLRQWADEIENYQYTSDAARVIHHILTSDDLRYVRQVIVRHMFNRGYGFERIVSLTGIPLSILTLAKKGK